MPGLLMMQIAMNKAPLCSTWQEWLIAIIIVFILFSIGKYFIDRHFNK